MHITQSLNLKVMPISNVKGKNKKNNEIPLNIILFPLRSNTKPINFGKYLGIIYKRLYNVLE